MLPHIDLFIEAINEFVEYYYKFVRERQRCLHMRLIYLLKVDKFLSTLSFVKGSYIHLTFLLKILN